MNASIWGYFRIISGTLAGGIAGFYFMHRAELKYKVCLSLSLSRSVILAICGKFWSFVVIVVAQEMWEERLRKYEEELNRRKKIEEANSSNEFPESL